MKKPQQKSKIINIELFFKNSDVLRKWDDDVGSMKCLITKNFKINLRKISVD